MYERGITTLKYFADPDAVWDPKWEGNLFVFYRAAERKYEIYEGGHPNERHREERVLVLY